MLKVFTDTGVILPGKHKLKRLAQKSFAVSAKLLAGKLPKNTAIIFVDEKLSRKLNLRYRKKNKPANVLSFIYDDYAEIFVAPEVIRQEAQKKSGVTCEFLLAKMIIHGIIHASGVNHEISKKEERKFELLEQKILNNLLKIFSLTS